jgi:aryl-alcohol dehydrogenase-like predicted oxidoreductase
MATETREILTRTIPSTGEELPVLGLGTWQTFDVGASESERAPLAEVLRDFAALGGTLVDSSPMYGRSEEVVGAVWTPGRQKGIEQMESSFRKMRTDRFDLLQVHNLVDVEAHLATLRGWKANGRVRYIGVTHYTASAHAEVEAVLRREAFDFLQINYSVAEPEAERRILPLAQEKGIAVIANRPFATGSLLRRLSKRPLPGWAAEIDCASWAQVLLKFVVSHPAVTCAIPATASPAHLRDNMGAGSGRLPDGALRARIAAESLR